MTKDLKTVSMQEGVRKTRVFQTRRDKFSGGKDNRILNRCSLWLLGRRGKNVEFQHTNLICEFSIRSERQHSDCFDVLKGIT